MGCHFYYVSVRNRDADELFLSPQEMELQEAKKKSALHLWSNAGGSQQSSDAEEETDDAHEAEATEDFASYLGPGSGSPNPMKGRKRRGSLTRRR
jgi:hypothetical protein